MSSAISTFQMLDPRLAISDQIKFAVDVGSQSANQQVFASQTFSQSQVSVNCLIPSLQVVVDRNVLIKTTFTLAITGSSNAGGTQLIQYPTNLVFGAFPFSQMVQTLTCQINNTSVNSNYETNLPLMLRQMDAHELAKYSDFAPTQLDYYQSPSTAGTLSSFNSIQTTPDYDVKSRGSFRIVSVSGDTLNAGEKTVLVTIETTEPIFCSPFQFGDAVCDREAGLSGISSINFNFNIGANLVGRAVTWKYLQNAGDALQNVVLQGFSKVEVLMTFLSAKPSQLLPLTCCSPYYEMPSYKTIHSTPVASGSAFTINSSIVAPNCIPDAVYLFVRNTAQTAIQNAQQAEFYYPINKVSVTWNTQSGLLASAQVQQLYLMSKHRGLKQDFLQFAGKACGTNALGINLLDTVNTTGSILALGFNSDIPIMEQYYSSSSLGLWSFSCSVDCVNTTLVQSPALELVIVFFQSGLFQSTSGSSSQYVGLLSKEEVLRVSQEPYVTHTDAKRLVGAGDNFLANMMKGSPAPMKALLKGALGGMGSMSAGSMSAGAVSAGRRVPRTH